MTKAKKAKKTSERDKKRLLKILADFKKARILVLGDLILDEFVWGNVNRISPEAPVPVVEVTRETFTAGGSLNTAHNVRRLRGTVYPCGVLGNDIRGQMLLKVMKKFKVDVGGVITDKGRPTTLKTRVFAHTQQVVRFDREKVTPISKAVIKKIMQFIEKKIDNIDCVLIEDYGKGVIVPDLLKQVVKLAKAKKKVITVDPKEEHFSFYKGVTSMTPNYKEALFASGLRGRHVTTEAIGKKLLQEYKLESLLLTLGEQGMMLFQKNGKRDIIPTTAQEVFDVSGAGDTVIAVFSLALSVGAKLLDAAVLANLAAGIVVGKRGTALVLPQELEKAIATL